MKTETFCICDRCNKPITNSEDGIAIQGNIYTATPNLYTLMIGKKGWQSNTEDEVPLHSYHIICFIKVLVEDNGMPLPSMSISENPFAGIFPSNKGGSLKR